MSKGPSVLRSIIKRKNKLIRDTLQTSTVFGQARRQTLQYTITTGSIRYRFEHDMERQHTRTARYDTQLMIYAADEQ
jgi:hypothetical protein